FNMPSPTEQAEDDHEIDIKIESDQNDTADSSIQMTPQSHHKSFKISTKSVEKKAKKIIRRVSSVGSKDRRDKYKTSKEDISNLSHESIETPTRLRSTSMATIYTDHDDIPTLTPRRMKSAFSSLRLKASQRAGVLADLAKTTLNHSKTSFGSSTSLSSSVTDSPNIGRTTPPPRPPRPVRPPRPPLPNFASSPKLSLSNDENYDTSNPFYEDDEIDDYQYDSNSINDKKFDQFNMTDRRLRRLTEIEELDDQNPFKDDSDNKLDSSGVFIKDEIIDDNPFEEEDLKVEARSPFDENEGESDEIFKKVQIKSDTMTSNSTIVEKIRRDEFLQMKPVKEKIETDGCLQKTRYEFQKESSLKSSHSSSKTKDLKHISENMTQKLKRYVSKEKISPKKDDIETNNIHMEEKNENKTEIDYSGREICVDDFSSINTLPSNHSQYAVTAAGYGSNHKNSNISKSSLSVANSSTSSLDDHNYSDVPYVINNENSRRQRHPSIGNLDDTDIPYRKKKKEHDTLSLASFRQRAGSIKFSPDKAVNMFKRIGSLRNLSPKKKNSKYNDSPCQVNDETITSNVNSNSNIDNDIRNTLQRTESVPALPRRSYSLRITNSKGANFLKQFGSLRRRPSFQHPTNYSTEISDDTDMFSGHKEEEISEEEFKEEVFDNNQLVIEEKIYKGPIQEFLESHGELNIQDHCIGQTIISLKDLIWSRESKDRYVLTAYTGKDNHITSLSNKVGRSKLSENESQSTSCLGVHCCLQVKADIVSQAYQVYYNTFEKLVTVKTKNKDPKEVFNGSVGVVGDILLEQIVFFWNISPSHRALAHWLVFAKVDKVDEGCLLGWLKKIKESIEATNYEPPQEQTLARSLCQWVLKVVEEEFEHLHKSFKLTSEYIEIQRLENILRCFAIIESSGSLKCAFERQSRQYSMGGARECLEGGITKHTELWVSALQKEMLESHHEEIPPRSHSRQVSISSTTEVVGPSPKLIRSLSRSRFDARKEAEGEEWLEIVRRASVLMDPVLSFITISVQTYQPIFKKELGIDYVYLIWPKLLAAAVYLIKPLSQKHPKDIIQTISEERLTVAVASAWDLCAHLSEINKLGKSEHLPPHLVPQLYRPGFASCIQQWLDLSSRLAIHGINNDIEQENFESRDEDNIGISAKGAADLISAICGRLGGLCWIDGIQDPTVLSSTYEQINNLLTHYSAKITNAFTKFLQKGKITEQMCLVVGSVSYVCERATNALSQRLGMANDDRDHHYHNELITSTAAALIQMCMPDLQKDIKKMISINEITSGGEGGVGGVVIGVNKDIIQAPFNPKKIISIIEEALAPVKNHLYLAEKLLDQLWKHFFTSINNIQKRLNQKSNSFYEEYRRLGQILNTAHSFVTSSNGVGFELYKNDTEDFEKLSAELKLKGATQEELLVQYFQERYEEQQKLEYELGNCLILNARFENHLLVVHIIQGPGFHQGALVKARVTPEDWFPKIDAQKTSSSKKTPAVYDEEFTFNVNPECDGVKYGGFLILQVRTQKLGRPTVVHGECFLPLQSLRSVSKDQRNTVKHQRLLLSKPKAIENYSSLQHLQKRANYDKSARAFLADMEKKMGIL
ncbi:unnamed protein product, partial [Meganyctiphanes norvegica]